MGIAAVSLHAAMFNTNAPDGLHQEKSDSECCMSTTATGSLFSIKKGLRAREASGAPKDAIDNNERYKILS